MTALLILNLIFFRKKALKLAKKYFYSIDKKQLI